MKAVRRAGTAPELLVRSALHRRGLRFRKQYKVSAAGRLRTVDVAFPSLGLAIFIDGCFWHCCPEHGTIPKRNVEFWEPKLRRNAERDVLVSASLRRQGWKVLRIWEHTPPAEAVRLIEDEFDSLRHRARLIANDGPRTAVDLFAGAGGSTQGLKQAGFEVVGAVESDSACAETYRANHTATELIEKDIRQVSPAALMTAAGLRRGELDLLNACPPCQGFSSLGATDEDDERNDLVTLMAPFVRELQPRAFVLENVPGLFGDARLDAFLAAARDASYGVKAFEVNATDFGVAQNRRRLIVFGIKGLDDGDLPEHPADLLPVAFRRQPERIFKVISRAGPLKGTQDPVHRGRPATGKVAQRIKLIPRNGGRFDLPEDHQLACHRSLGSKRSAAAPYGRLRLDEPAPTLTTRCTTPSCGRFVHPVQDRGITLREAALIQTFPGRYKFKGSYQAIEGQVGNAVPVRMAQALAMASRALTLAAEDD